jgi:hypothetical protein
MILIFRLYITIAIIIIWNILNICLNEFHVIDIIDILLLYIVGYIFPFFGFKKKTQFEIPVLLFFLINISLMGRAVTKLNSLLIDINVAWIWAIKILILAIYAIILIVSHKRGKDKMIS